MKKKLEETISLLSGIDRYLALIPLTDIEGVLSKKYTKLNEHRKMLNTAIETLSALKIESEILEFMTRNELDILAFLTKKTEYSNKQILGLLSISSLKIEDLQEHIICFSKSGIPIEIVTKLVQMGYINLL